mmetsp:Transcript_26782/g.48267  ORF Transcript_26782/g.48267 Transcript_26782/m.48267 type:complete len:405 (+) Transcript_26782:305-1519(+)
MKLAPSVLSSIIVKAVREAPHRPPSSLPSTVLPGIQRTEYQRHLIGEPMLDYLRVGKSEVFIVSSSEIGVNLYKILEEIKPQRIVLQVRADEVFYKNFQVLQPFERLVDLNLSFSPEQVMPSYAHYVAARDHMASLGMRKSRNTLEPNNFKAYRISTRLSLESITYASMWGLHEGINSIVLGAAPLALQYPHLTSQLSLVQLVQLASSVCTRLGQYPDLISRNEPEVPLTAASKLFSDIFLGFDDEFTARVVSYLADEANPIVVLAGTGQHYGIRHYLEQPTRDFPIDQNPRLKSIIRTDKTEVVIDKIAFLDVFFNGPLAFVNVLNSPWNYRALELIRSLVDEDEKAGKVNYSVGLKMQTLDMYHKLYLSLLRKHSTFIENELKKGKEQLHADFLKTVLDTIN